MLSILIVDDSRYSRTLLQSQLAQLGHKTMTASDGQEAWEVVQREPVNLVVTDWLMPELNGVELCRRIREADFSRYIYIILLTVKDGKNDMIAGIEAGADDFIVKPCSLSELKVKMFTGQRVLKYEGTLMERNDKLMEAHQKLSQAYGVIDESLKAAAQLYEALLPRKATIINGTLFEALYMPCEYAAGDMFNYFKIREDLVVFYQLDVAGHGIPAAMLSFTLNHVIRPLPLWTQPIDDASPDGGFLKFDDPGAFAIGLNKMFQSDSESARSFTITYGVIDYTRRKVVFIQAGHPPPIYLPRQGMAKTVGSGGFPIGYFADANFDRYELDFNKGDRLICYSDGVTDCRNQENQPYSVGRLLSRMEASRNQSLNFSLEDVRNDLLSWRAEDNFKDDLSILGMEFGPEVFHSNDLKEKDLEFSVES